MVGYLSILNLMSSQSRSPSPKRNRSPSQDKNDNRKLFITNLDGETDIGQLEKQLRRLFEKQGPIESLVVKKNRNSDYSFAFIEMKDHKDATNCAKHLDHTTLNGKQIKVQFQDDGKRRKDSNKGCYNCGKKGHFARECRMPKSDDRDGYGRHDHRNNRSRSRSNSSEHERKKKHKKRNRSESSRRERSYSKEKKSKRNRSKDRDEKKKKRYKRSSS